MDFTGNIEQSMSIILAYTGKIEFFNITLTEWIFLVVSLPWAIVLLQKLFKTFIPGLEFDPVTGSDYDPEWHEERDALAIENYEAGYHDPESSDVMRRYRKTHGWKYRRRY